MIRDDIVLSAFRQARYRVRTAGGSVSLQVGHKATELSTRWPSAHSFALITAYNPRATRASASSNRRCARELAALLNDCNIVHVPSRSSAPDGSWAEPGWLLVDPDLDWLDSLAQRFKQCAVLAWTAAEPVRLRRYPLVGDTTTAPSTRAR